MHKSIGYAYHQKKYSKLIKASIKLQIASALLISVVLLISSGAYMAYSAIVGAASAIVPNLCFAYFSFRHTGANKAKKILHSIYFAETLKFILVICLLVISNRYASVTGVLSNLGILIGFGTTFFSLIFLPRVTK